MECTPSRTIRNIAPPPGCVGGRGSGFHCTRRINWRLHKKSGRSQGKIEVISKLLGVRAAISKNANTSSPRGRLGCPCRPRFFIDLKNRAGCQFSGVVRSVAGHSPMLKRRAPTSHLARAGAPREGTSGVLVLWGGFDGSFATMTRHLYACIDEV